jgi:protein-tyrosine phosphatase
MVHCLAGVCRSPAVAAAISQIKYNDDSLYFDIYHPNTLVYNTMLFQFTSAFSEEDKT